MGPWTQSPSVQACNLHQDFPCRKAQPRPRRGLDRSRAPSVRHFRWGKRKRKRKRRNLPNLERRSSVQPSDLHCAKFLGCGPQPLASNQPPMLHRKSTQCSTLSRSEVLVSPWRSGLSCLPSSQLRIVFSVRTSRHIHILRCSCMSISAMY